MIGKLWDRDAFMAALLARYPEMARAQDTSFVGLLHCEMGWFSHTTTDAIAATHFACVRDHFEFIDMALSEASPELENAILVSYLENVFAADTPHTRRARDLLTPRLAAEV